MATHTTSLHDRQNKHTFSNAIPSDSVLQELVGVLQQIVQNAGALLKVNNCSIALVEGEKGMLVTRAALQKSGHKTRQTRFVANEGVAGWVAEHREPLVINDVARDPRYKRLGRTPIGSILCVPLIDTDNFIGTLTASSADLNAFDASKLQMLTIFAEQAVLAITNTRHAELAQRQASQLELLLDLSQDITTLLDVEMLYRTILRDSHRLVPCLQATLYTYDSESQKLSRAAELLDTDTQQKQEGTPLLVADVAQREKIALHDETSLTAWAGVHRHPMVKVPHDVHDTAEIATPLVSKNTLYGVIALCRPKAFTSEELLLVRNLSNMAAAALENATLFQTVHADQKALRAVLEASSDGIAIVTVNGSFMEVNPAFGRIFGLDPAQLLGMEYMELFEVDEELSHESHASLAKLSVALQQQQMLPHVEIDVMIQDVSRSIGLSVTPVATASRPICLMIARDVTAIRDASRVKANFLSMITHELRSPLNAINGYLDLTLAGIGGELNEQQREFMQRARAGSEHLYALVEDLLFISRADSGQLRLSRDVVDLSEVLANAVEELEVMAIDNGVTIEVEIADDVPSVYADGMRVQQVLRNLLNNALNFTPAGNVIKIAVARQAAQKDGIQHAHVVPLEEAEQGMVVISVEDHGCGIDPEYQERIFERFYQAPMPRVSKQGSGQGLGLAIVRMVIELHGGQVMVDSAPGAGSTFSFTLPYGASV